MKNILCGIAALILGLLLVGGYGVVLSAQWYLSLSQELSLFVVDTTSLISRRELLAKDWLLMVMRSIPLSFFFALFFSILLDAFYNVARVAHYAVWGALLGCLYILLPAAMHDYDQRLIELGIQIPVSSQLGFIEALMAYLPIFILVFFIATRRVNHYQRPKFV